MMTTWTLCDPSTGSRMGHATLSPCTKRHCTLRALWCPIFMFLCCAMNVLCCRAVELPTLSTSASFLPDSALDSSLASLNRLLYFLALQLTQVHRSCSLALLTREIPHTVHSSACLTSHPSPPFSASTTKSPWSLAVLSPLTIPCPPLTLPRLPAA